MTFRRTLLPLFLLPLLAGCATSVDRYVPPPPVVAPNIPAIPPDVLTCATAPTDPGEGALDAGTAERLWSTDRASLVKVNSCLRRIICEYQGVRKDIGQIDTAVCAAPPAAKRKHKAAIIWSDITGKVPVK